MLRNGQTMSTLSVDYGPSSVDIHPGLTEVAVGGSVSSYKCIDVSQYFESMLDFVLLSHYKLILGWTIVYIALS